MGNFEQGSAPWQKLPLVPSSLWPNYSSQDTDGFDDAYIQGQLDTVVYGINNRWGRRVLARLNSGALPIEMYNAVVIRIVSRVVANPDGLKEEHEGQYGYQTHQMVGSGYIWYTDDDRIDLTGQLEQTSASQWPIGTARTNLQEPRGWVRP